MPGLPDIPPGIETIANAALAELIGIIDAMQPGFLATNGKMYQGITTPATYPANGNTEPPNLSLKPTDQAQDWTGIISNTAKVISRQVNVSYNDTDGWNYMCVGYITIALNSYYAESNDPSATEFNWIEITE